MLKRRRFLEILIAVPASIKAIASNYNGINTITNTKSIKVNDRIRHIKSGKLFHVVNVNSDIIEAEFIENDFNNYPFSDIMVKFLNKKDSYLLQWEVIN